MASKHDESGDIQGIVNNGITGEQRSILKKEIKKSRGDNDKTKKRPNKVSPNLCEEMTNRYENEDVTYKEISQSLHIHMTTVWRHVNDECEHSRNLHITQNECNFMRTQAEMGETIRDIARSFRKCDDDIYASDDGLDYMKITLDGMATKVSYHVRGKCEHDTDIKPLSRSETRKNELKEDGIKSERMGQTKAVFENV